MCDAGKEPALRETVVFLTGITSFSENFTNDFEYWRLEQSKMDNKKYKIVYANTGVAPDPHTGAVKLFAILTGYPVYFGKEYARNFGVDVEKPNGFVAEHKEWCESDAITLIAHGNGVLCAYHLQYLLARNHWKEKYGRETSADMIRAIIGINAAFGSPVANLMNGGTFKDYEHRTAKGLKEPHTWESTAFMKAYAGFTMLSDYIREDSLMVETNNAAYPFKINNFSDLVCTLTGRHVVQRKKCTAAWFLTFHGQKELQELWFKDDVLPHKDTLYINLCGDKYDLSINWHPPKDANDILTTIGALVFPFTPRRPEFEPALYVRHQDLFRHDGLAYVIHQAFPFMVNLDLQRKITPEMLSDIYINTDDHNIKAGTFNWLVIEGGDHNLIKTSTENFRENIINRTMEIVTIFGKQNM